MERGSNASRRCSAGAGHGASSAPSAGTRGTCTLQGRRLFQCHRCGRQTSVIAGTVFADFKLALNVWFLAMHLITQA